MPATKSDRLTVTFCKAAKPKPGGARVAKYPDGRGLHLQVEADGSESGAKGWRFRYRFGGKEKMISFGTLADTSLAEAREAREEARKLLKRGIDPSTQRKAAKRATAAAVSHTFEAVARGWHAWHKANATGKRIWSADHAETVMADFERLLFPTLGSRPIGELKRDDLAAALDAIDSPATRHYTHRKLSEVFCYASAKLSAVESDPTALLKPYYSRPKSENWPTLKPAQLPDFLRALDAYDDSDPSEPTAPVAKLMTQFCALTFARTDELRLTKWSDVNMETRLMEIPAERMKRTRANAGSHLIPLSRQALAILRKLAALRVNEYVFPGTRPNAPINKQAMLGVVDRLGYFGMMSGHGFRHMASTALNGVFKADKTTQVFSPDVIERQLAHVRPGVRAVYNKADYLPQRVALMQAWADMLDSYRKRADGSNVVDIDTAPRRSKGRRAA